MQRIIVRFIIWLVAATALLLIAAHSTSPLSNFLGSDSIMYRLMGQCWYNGDTVYVDLFDNKGPYLYLIQMLGIGISPERWGIFLLQTLNFACIFELLYRITTLFTANIWKRITTIGLSVILCLSIFEGGNLTEDWSLSFILLPLYLSLKWLIKSPHTSHPYSATFVYGVCIGIISMIRINNTAIICGIILGLTAIYIVRRQFKTLAYQAIIFIIGLLTATIPMIIYFSAIGALDDMFYATILYNIKYSEVWPTIVDTPTWQNVIRLLPCAFVAIISLLYDYRHKTLLSFIIIPAAAITFAAFFNSSGFYHYFVLVIPIFFLALSLSLELSRWVAPIAIACVIINPLYADRIETNAALIKLHNTLFTNTAINNHPYSQIVAKIPKEERDSVFGYNLSLIQNDIFLQMSTIPTMKYSYMHDEISLVDTIVRNDIHRYMTTQRPLWIAVQPSSSDSLLSSMLSNYRLAVHTKVMNLYRRRQSNDNAISAK